MRRCCIAMSNDRTGLAFSPFKQHAYLSHGRMHLFTGFFIFDGDLIYFTTTGSIPITGRCWCFRDMICWCATMVGFDAYLIVGLISKRKGRWPSSQNACRRYFDNLMRSKNISLWHIIALRQYSTDIEYGLLPMIRRHYIYGSYYWFRDISGVFILIISYMLIRFTVSSISHQPRTWYATCSRYFDVLVTLFEHVMTFTHEESMTIFIVLVTPGDSRHFSLIINDNTGMSYSKCLWRTALKWQSTTCTQDGYWRLSSNSFRKF